jgi:interleukin-1 receptor-associated kinase 1/coatomer subunit beta'
MEQYSEQLMRCIEMALSCVEKEWHKRPRIGDIIRKLNEMEMKDQGSLEEV